MPDDRFVDRISALAFDIGDLLDSTLRPTTYQECFEAFAVIDQKIYPGLHALKKRITNAGGAMTPTERAETRGRA